MAEGSVVLINLQGKRLVEFHRKLQIAYEFGNIRGKENSRYLLVLEEFSKSFPNELPKLDAH